MSMRMILALSALSVLVLLLSFGAAVPARRRTAAILTTASVSLALSALSLLLAD